MRHVEDLFEMRLLSPTLEELNNCSDETRSSYYNSAANGSYRDVIKLAKLLEGSFCPNNVDDVKVFGDTVKNLLEDSDGNRAERELEILCFGISCLQLFVLSNWTGPGIGEEGVFPELSSKQANNEILKILEVDGEHVYHLISDPILLCLAMKIFEQPDIFVHYETSYWWCLRYVSVHQRLLSERSPHLYELSVTAIESINNRDFYSNLSVKSYRIQLHLEMGLLQLHYYQYKEAEKNFDTAYAISGISCNLDGALGVRTKFQQSAVAQLKVQIDRKSDGFKSFSPLLSEDDVAKTLPLNDDTLLESVKFNDNEANPAAKLSAEEQAVVLSICTSMQKTSPSHRLRDEEISCVIEYLLTDPKSWTVHCEALRLRCLLEKDRSRTVERSMAQLESLVKNISMKTTASQTPTIAVKRLALFYSVWPKPSWILQKQLAALFASLGVISSALDIYLRVHMWEDAIVCLIRTGRGHEAEKVIREQLAIKETANLYCLLGDLLQDPEQYTIAWEFSKHRSARAMRSLGAYKVSKKLHHEAIECFEKSLKVNYMQVGTYFSMGCCALTCGEYEKAAKSFQKCVSLSWDNFQAWTNLSTAFVRSGKKLQAYKALTEGLKCNFNRWELWENYLFICVDTGHFRDAIRSYNRLLDLRDKFVDAAVLKVLVTAIIDGVIDANEQSASKLRPIALELFGRLTSKTTSDWEVWSLYASLHGDGKSDHDDSNMKALHYLQKALRSSMQRHGWEKTEKSAEENVQLCDRLVAACLHLKESEGRDVTVDQTLLVSTRLSVNGVKAKLKVHEKSLLADEARGRYNVLVDRLEDKLDLLSGNSV